MSQQSYYEILGITRVATASEVKAAYKRRAKETHPDAGGSAAEFYRVREAYRVLSSPLDRRSYDRTRIREHSERYWASGAPPPSTAEQGWPGPGNASVSGDDDSVDRLLDLAVRVGRPIFWISQKIGDWIEAMLGDSEKPKKART